MFLYVNYPSWLHPEIIHGFKYLRWYGLMYLVAFFIAYLFFKLQVKRGELLTLCKQKKDMSLEDISNVFTYGIIGLLLGARIFGTLVYNSSYYLTRPYLIFWPFATHDGRLEFTGFQGMSYHGGFIGGFFGVLLWCKLNKFDFLAIADVMALSIPFGYTFGRLGNFANGELYGRITTSRLGMIFPQVPLQERFDANLDWVKDFATQIGITIQEGARTVNLPRHPSQLYEALFEGVVLGLILFFLRKKKPFNGFVTCLYAFGYGFFRFIIEYFRQPDADLGYIINGTGSTNIYIYESWKNLSMGHLLCLTMMVLSLASLIFLFYKKRVSEWKSK